MKTYSRFFKSVLIFISCFGGLRISAQTVFVRGIVQGRDMSSGDEIIMQNAKVDFIDSCTEKTYTNYTDKKGNFSIEVPGDCPVFKYAISKPHDCDFSYYTSTGIYKMKERNDSIRFLLQAVYFIELPRFPFLIFQDNSFTFYYTTDSAGYEIDSTKTCDVTDLKNCGDSAQLFYFSEILNCESLALITIKCYYSKAEKNDVMAKKRAEYVLNYLIQKGIERNRFTIETQPFPAGKMPDYKGDPQPDQSRIIFFINGYKKDK
jgi:hypothetical protein